MGIINTVKEFIAYRGFTFMIFGISVAAAGVLAYAFLNTPRYAATIFPKAAVGLAVLGFAAYIVGRVSLGMQRNDNKRKAMELLSRRDEESFEPPPGNNDKSGVQ
ncbi:MAG: hypothetical protein LBB74_06330 [Chitinispirillales bacterium]|jgi:hypothetical protein|nr:hypothetical protein [Chitinispirillales bacterium]